MLKKTMVLGLYHGIVLLIFSSFYAAHTLAEPCKLGKYPIPTWTVERHRTATADTETDAKHAVEEKIEEVIDQERAVCLANKGEAYWYNFTHRSCITNAKSQIVCRTTVELLCEEKDY